mgnify:CR=1 FL=1
MTWTLSSPDIAPTAFVRDLDAFRDRLQTLPNVAHALATGHILPITDSEIRQTFLACIDTIAETPGPYESGRRLNGAGGDVIHVEPALFQDVYGIDLVKALWAGQLARKLELGDVLDVSRLSDAELAKLFNRKPQ